MFISINDDKENFIEETLEDDKILVHKVLDIKVIKPINKKNEVEITILEYKNKYILLYFSIKKFFLDDEKRIIVVIFVYNPNDITNNYFVNMYYTSNSNSFLWRYLLLNGRSSPYEKGYNYLSSSFVNMDIQKYIYSEFINFELDLDTNIFNEYYKYNYNRIDNDESIIKINNKLIYEKLKDRINTKKYVYPNKLFNIINTLFPLIVYIENINLCIYYIEEIIGRKFYFPMVNQYGNPRKEPTYYKGSQEIKNYKENLLIFSNEITQDDKNIIKNVYCLIMKYLPYTYFKSEIGDERYRNILRKIKNILNDIFLLYFEIKIETKKDLFGHNIDFNKESEKPDDKQKIICNSLNKSVEIIYKNYPYDTYILYYSVYKCDFIDTEMKTILHIAPKNDNYLNIFGLDNYYCIGGALINKIFEYPQQVKKVREHENHDESKSNDYRFIGDFTNYDFLP